MRVLNKDKKGKLPDLADLIKPNLILLDSEAKDREDAVLLGCNLLVGDGAIIEEYCNLILRSLEETKINKVL
jgi:mannitol/fructose-specific phosphotransferase system IIA component (Ntr-type)